MKKRFLCLAMTVLMVVGASMTVNAVDYQGKDGWKADFNGKKIESNFNLADEAINIQPGDSIELKVQVKNSGTDKTDWYLANEVIASLEDAKKQATGGAYEYRLAFVNSANEEKVLYDSETVGGEGDGQNGEGLHQATDSLKDYIYLDRLEAGKSGTVHLRIKVDGETQGNGYQQTLAKLQMNFAVEKVGVTQQGKDQVIKQVVKTGDTSRALLLSILALASGIILLILAIYTMKKRKRSRKGE